MSAIVKKLRRLTKSELATVNRAIANELARRTDVREAKELLWEADDSRPTRSLVAV
jgi:hypothetical protein